VIVTFGITALVGSLTAVDGIGFTLNESLASLGANTFDIYSKNNRGASQQGVKQKVFKPLQLNEVQRFIDQFKVPSNISLSADLTGMRGKARFEEDESKYRRGRYQYRLYICQESQF